jgi:RHS repeat-associated protein
LIDPTGQVHWAASYEAWGGIGKLHVNLIDNPIRLQGQYADQETGLYYNRNRYYAPAIGAFLSQDPLGLAAGLNVYNLAPNALGWVDPLGLNCGSTKAAKGVIDPSTVRFSQNSAKGAFSEGGSIQGMADALRSGALKADQVPAIRLVERDGKLFSLDNRRLEAFRRAEMDVPYRMATPQEAAREAWKFTTRNDGVSIRIRGE